MPYVLGYITTLLVYPLRCHFINSRDDTCSNQYERITGNEPRMRFRLFLR